MAEPLIVFESNPPSDEMLARAFDTAKQRAAQAGPMTVTVDEALLVAIEGKCGLGDPRGVIFPEVALALVSRIRALHDEAAALRATVERYKNFGNYSHLIRIISEIRETSGVGAGPMLSDLPQAIADRVATAQHKARDEVAEWHDQQAERAKARRTLAEEGLEQDLELLDQKIHERSASYIRAWGERSVVK